MIVTKDLEVIQRLRVEQKDKSWGFVPTMGFLHRGHISLVEKALVNNDFCVASIYVNPMQFNEKDDFESYPQDLESDYLQLESAGVDLVFTPDQETIYPTGFASKITIPTLCDILEGASRPGHFDGVCTVITKLFHMIQPDKAYFGEKDAQQLLIIKKLVNDLNFTTEVIGCPTRRERDGLAMSSRNVRLTSEARQQSPILFKSLQKAKDMIVEGERDPKKVVQVMTDMINTEPLAKIELVSINNSDTLAEISTIEGNVLISLAVIFGNVRLIDNISMIV